MNDAIPTIAEAAALIERRALSPLELTRDCLERIARYDGVLHSFICVTEERALADARAAEAAITSGDYRGPLHGIPIGLKDIFNTAGIPTTAHSRHLERNVPDEDATAVRLLREAGTVLMGKLATHEFALGGPSFDLPWPPARNPWDPERFTGGSSSGTGAAVAAGLILGGTGSDTGGSIRTPAAYCGLAGIKPTYGRVSTFGVLPLAFSLDHVGVLALTSEDCAILLGAIAGADPRDPSTSARAVPDFRAELDRGVAGLRIGVVRSFYENDNPADEPTRAAIEAALATLRAAGARVGDVTLPSLMEWYSCGTVINMAESFAVHAQRLRTAIGAFGERLRDRLVLGALIGGADYVQAMRRRRALCAQLERTMADVDVLVTASVAGEAPPITGVPKWANFTKPGFSMPFNLSGYPAMSVCTGFGPNGLPLAMQLAAKPFAEPTLLRVAHSYERLTGWRERRPVLAAVR
jgi:aspartyl-tRNA(Asn)/glutamyl-tRNA(Gln) amidotransferase subunit A